jgi:3-dehydroquinate dehydratase-1
MSRASISLPAKRPLVVGSFGDAAALQAATRESLAPSCDIAEIRLDLLLAETGEVRPDAWRHLDGMPLLFTARRAEEGGAGDLSAQQRAGLLQLALPDAAIIDIEVASAEEMQDMLSEMRRHDIPWVASFHDFTRLPAPEAMENALRSAKDSGAAVFKLAARLHQPSDAARLADFQLADHGILVATMGMGPLAPVSRLLCAQCGSVLNYGYLGDQPTAPGQWSATRLRDAISSLSH